MKEGEPKLKTPHRSRPNIKSMLILFFDRCGIDYHVVLGDTSIVLSKLSLIWDYRLYQCFFELSIVFNSMNDSYLLSLFPISQ